MAAPNIPPILRLPDELLVEIVAAVQDRTLSFDPESESPRSEIVASQICHRFRRAVTAASTLWTQVTLDLCRDESAELARLYLDRSAGCRIEMNLRAMDEVQAPKGLHYLSPHIGRIARLTIAFEAHQALDSIFYSFQNVVMASLEHLEISSEYDVDVSVDLSPLKLTNITSLKMTRCTPPFPPPQWMAALTHLYLSKTPGQFPGTRIFSDLSPRNSLHWFISTLTWRS
ncbi:hypothetical protein FB45DRAFT_1028464 [Roridomyces roridus]|uniref:F-box domain-containing protein n=1 Tax=Roridomyces roridus TaxID=1738132 RepID=A0AAD7BQU0_9AGAR|nr:hypothetical protein FB45DRAFT_1028464 [Roridomyces roridus]